MFSNVIDANRLMRDKHKRSLWPSYGKFEHTGVAITNTNFVQLNDHRKLPEPTARLTPPMLAARNYPIVGALFQEKTQPFE